MERIYTFCWDEAEACKRHARQCKIENYTVVKSAHDDYSYAILTDEKGANQLWDKRWSGSEVRPSSHHYEYYKRHWKIYTDSVMKDFIYEPQKRQIELAW